MVHWRSLAAGPERLFAILDEGPTTERVFLSHRPREIATCPGAVTPDRLLGRDLAADPTAAPRLAPTVLALVDMTAHDTPVVETARTVAGPSRAAIVLLHVARPVSGNGAPTSGTRWRPAWWARMDAIDATMQRALSRLAARLRPSSIRVQTAVRFGDPVEQVAKAVIAAGATVVVACSRPARWRWWRDRDRRLHRLLDVPLVLVRPAGEEGSPTHGKRSRGSLLDQERAAPGRADRGPSPLARDPDARRRIMAKTVRMLAVGGLLLGSLGVASAQSGDGLGTALDRQRQDLQRQQSEAQREIEAQQGALQQQEDQTLQQQLQSPLRRLPLQRPPSCRRVGARVICD